MEKKTKPCEQGGKICIFNVGDCPFERYLSASHYSSTTWHLSLSPEAPHIKKKTSVAFGTFAFTADLWDLSAQGGKLPFIIQTLQKKKANWQAGVLSTSLPIGGHSSWWRVT